MAGVTVTADHNVGPAATPRFRFARVPSPVKDDAAASAAVRFVDGDLDENSAGLPTLVDGLLPGQEDEPGLNFFFQAGTAGGAIELDLKQAVAVAQINTYSWHPNTRGPQVYVVYGSDGRGAAFNPTPAADVDPATAGWTLIATVDTRQPGNNGGQYGVSIARNGAAIGPYRYLLFVCWATESDDDWGNTFYSEIDVIARAS